MFLPRLRGRSGGGIAHPNPSNRKRLLKRNPSPQVGEGTMGRNVKPPALAGGVFKPQIGDPRLPRVWMNRNRLPTVSNISGSISSS